MATVKLTGDYGYESKQLHDLASGTLVDATGAQWTLQNAKSNPAETGDCNIGSGKTNPYPLQIRNGGANIVALGGRMNGEVYQNAAWEDNYCNSAALRFENCASPTFEGWRIDKFWDGIRMSGNCNGFRIGRCHLSEGCDDALENDQLNGGLIADTLIDGVFAGLSMDSGGSSRDGSKNELVVDGVLMRMKPYSYKGTFSHQSPFKIQSDIAKVPRIRIRNSVFAISDVNHLGRSRLQRAWNVTVESSGNYFLNLSDTPLPSTYPKSFGILGGNWVGFTVLQGQAARDYWNTAKANWLGGTTTEPEEPEMPTEPLTSALVDCGGANDQYFSGGKVFTTTAAIAGADSDVYQSERYGADFAYAIPMANGNYDVTFKFAENWFTAAGKRVFNVYVDGGLVIDKLDVWQRAGGKNIAHDTTVPVAVTNEMLNIRFEGIVDNGKVNGIVVAVAGAAEPGPAPEQDLEDRVAELAAQFADLTERVKALEAK